MGSSTVSFGAETPRRRSRTSGWMLCVALSCERLYEAPARIVLDCDVVELGRGHRRAVTRGDALRIEFPDACASQRHARLTREGDGWRLADTASKNGTQIDGRPVDEASVGDGAVIACGGTFFVLRHSEGNLRDLDAAAGPTPTLRTLSPAFERELELLPKIARSNLPLLVRGETGTGKEIVANAVHALSGRSGPFVPVNCGAIPATLVESELFGSRRGAFSGAEDRPGLVRSAAGGTLFLDEIAELPLPSQVALLRMLQEGEVSPLGAGKAIPVDVRVVAATHQPIDALVTETKFRGDLYARLRGYELRLPRLRERREDLGLLVATLLARVAPERRWRLSRAAAQALFAHRWPFHVRELEQALRAATTIAAGDEIAVEDLRLDTHVPAPAPADERERLVAALTEHQGNVSAVARALATSRTQVQRLMTRHALDVEDYKRR